MSERMSRQEIEAHWRSQARDHGASPTASWSDVYAIELEIRALTRHLRDGQRVLDVGCGNGFTALALAERLDVSVRGVDFVAELVEHARSSLAARAAHVRDRVEFAVDSALELHEPESHYDAVLSVRMLINLGDWEHQARALAELARRVQPGGRLLLSEATLQGWSKLNGLRAEHGFDPIPVPAFNTYLDEEQVVAALAANCELQALECFSSSYFVGTRVLKPLLAPASGAALDVADPLSEWNRWCAEVPSWGDYGTQKLFVFERRG